MSKDSLGRQGLLALIGNIKSTYVGAINKITGKADEMAETAKRIEEEVKSGIHDGAKGDKGDPGKDGSPIYPKFRVDPHNMHLYCSDGSNRIYLDKNKHLRVRN